MVGIHFNEHVAGDGAVVFAHAWRPGAEDIYQSGWTAPIDPAGADLDQGPAIQPAPPYGESAAKLEELISSAH